MPATAKQWSNLSKGWELNSGWFSIDATGIDQIHQAMDEFGAGSGKIIDDVLQGEGAMLIKEKITPLLPVSGRKWRGKATAARSAMPAGFSQDNDSLSVTIAARGRHRYLYFPDDGSNTIKHAGNQQFMKRGAEAATPQIVERCVGKLIESIGG